MLWQRHQRVDFFPHFNYSIGFDVDLLIQPKIFCQSALTEFSTNEFHTFSCWWNSEIMEHDACQRGHLHFGTTSSLFRWCLAAYLDGKINKIQRNYLERPWREKHLEKQMLFPHCQKWSNQNKMYLSHRLCSVIRRNTRGSLSFVVADLFEAESFPCTFYFGCVFFRNIKGQFILTGKQTHSPQHPRWLVYCLPQCFFLFELTYLHSHNTIKNKST